MLQYYRFLKLKVPIQGPTVNCGDNSFTFEYLFHINDYFNVIYIENPLTNVFSIEIPQTLMLNCYPPTNCDICYNSTIPFVNDYNNSIQLSGPNIGNTGSPIFTTNVGARYNNPFTAQNLCCYTSSPGGSGSSCTNIGGLLNSFYEYSIQTMPFVPDPSIPGTWNNLTTLAASISCSLNPYTPLFDGNSNSTLLYVGYTQYHQSKFLNLSSSFNYNFNGGQSTDDFEIYTLTGLGATGSISNPNLCPENPSDMIFSYIGGVSTIVQPNFFINGSPTVIIDP